MSHDDKTSVMAAAPNSPNKIYYYKLTSLIIDL